MNYSFVLIGVLLMVGQAYLQEIERNFNDKLLLFSLDK